MQDSWEGHSVQAVGAKGNMLVCGKVHPHPLVPKAKETRYTYTKACHCERISSHKHCETIVLNQVLYGVATRR